MFIDKCWEWPIDQQEFKTYQHQGGEWNALILSGS